MAADDETRAILDVVDAAIDEHAALLQSLHRTAICGAAPPREILSDQGQYLCRFGAWLELNGDRGLVDQPVFRELGAIHQELHDHARTLVRRIVAGEEIPQDLYDKLVDSVDRFNLAARRIREAFRKAISELDPLTGVQTRRVMMDELERERSRAIRRGVPCCIALADIDRFKHINDTYGHAAGDQVLSWAAGRFVTRLRPYDAIYRYGGEEFLIVLPEADATTGRAIVERLRDALETAPMRLADGRELTVTASFGLAMLDAAVPLQETLKRADRALYAAKRKGRNRVVAWTPELDREEECGNGR